MCHPLVFSFLNLLVMHYYIFFTASIDDEPNFTRFVDNILGIVFDVTIVCLLSYLLSWKKPKIAYIATYFITLLWSFSNILYSRFFHHYISLSAIQQGGSLFDSFMLDILVDGIAWTDLYFILCPVVFIYLMRKTESWTKTNLRVLLLILPITIVINLMGYALFCIMDPKLRYVSFMIERVKARHFDNSIQLCNPNVASFRRGTIRSLASEWAMNMQGAIHLDDQKRKEIDGFISASISRHADDKPIIQPRNIIFIIVESYMSFVGDMKVDGKEVTPFLNCLRKDSSVFYNGHIKKNVTIGESSDGQFIYMTGLLPLRSVVTITSARKAYLPPSLPKQTGRRSRMIIPTVETMWRQDEMCRQYGFDTLYTSKDYSDQYLSVLNDEQVVDMAIDVDRSSTEPFFSVILTMSMHQPFNDQIDQTFIINDHSIRKDLASYLNKCHYTDRQLKRYFEHLHESGLYDNSLIVMIADHPVLSTDFGGVKDYIPLYLIYKDIQKINLWQGECNQIDVYATLIDLLCPESKWYGLGNSLASVNYRDNVNDKLYTLSESIIRGDYFK